MRVGLFKPSFEEEEEGTEGNQRMFGRTRGSTILLWIPSVLIFSVLDRRCCATCWGEITKEFAIGDFERSPPHLFLYLFLFKRKKRWKQKGLYRFWTPGSLNFIQKKWEVLEAPDFILFLFFYYFLFYVKIFRATSRQFLVYGRKLHHRDSSCSCHGDVVPSVITIFFIYCRSSCKVSAQIQLWALQRYYDRQNRIPPSKRALTLRWS